MTGWLLVSAIGFVVFLLRRRRFDVFSVAFFSAQVYFLPAYFGFVLRPMGAYGALPAPLLDASYHVMIAVVAAIVAGALFHDRYAPERRPSFRMAGAEHVAWIATVLAVAGFVLTVHQAGGRLLAVEKHTVMESLGRGHLLWTYGASIGAVIAFARGSWGLFVASTALLVADLLIGFRFSFALTMIAVLTLVLADDAPGRLLRRWRMALVVLALGLFVMVYHHLKVPIKTGQLGTAIVQMTSPAYYAAVIATSEPFVTQAILNETLARDFRVGPEHLRGVVDQLVLFSPELGSDHVTFGDRFGARFFPERWGGMGSNVWAHAWSVGGWGFLIVFLGLWIALLSWGSTFLRARDPVIRGGAALLWSYGAFYIHRNGIVVQLGIEKRALLILVACWLASYVIHAATRGAEVPLEATR